MSIYYFDLSDEAVRYTDDVGTDIQDRAMVEVEALGVLQEFARRRSEKTDVRTCTVIVRNAASNPVFFASMVVMARWLDTPVT